ncbi:AAA family ATPase [Micromonospora trifolii]|uniref:AAA family ATPase n=1 Tax=Micromonospora trifolii TaxID=2911208 RepID=UPI003CE7FDE7
MGDALTSRCVLITGAIGSGKTTISSILVSRLALPYVSPDLYFQYLLSCACCSDDRRYDLARRLCRHRLEFLRDGRRSFVWETVMASDWKWDFLSTCRRTHFLTVIYVSVGLPEVCVERADRRADAGWYRVSSQKVMESHSAMSRRRDRLAQLANQFILIDNSDDLAGDPTEALERVLIHV